MSEVKPITYFLETGENNTSQTLEAARRRAEELGIKDIVVASTRGSTGVKAVEAFKGLNVVVVTHSAGFREPGKLELDEEAAEKIRRGGGKILTASHAFAGVSRAIRKKFNTLGPAELMANTLRLFCEGMKVCVEITAMAADAGLIPMDREVIAIAGTGRGADTAVVIKPAHLSDIFDLRVQEIITKPRKR
jgi:hypothetical protein